MTKHKYKSGDIFQITLPNNTGYAYVLCINLLEMYGDNARYPSLIHVYNYRSEESKVVIEDVTRQDLILCPLLIAGINVVIKKGSWKKYGSLPFNQVNIELPYYKKAEPDEENASEWYYIINADVSQKVKTEYDKVKHLENFGAIGAELVATKISMALLHDEGKNLSHYFKFEEYYEKYFYSETINIPAYYKQPIEKRGKV